MFTVCPKCALTLVVTAADLRVAQGYVRCGRCSSVFNALARLADERQGSALGAEAAAAPSDLPAASVAEDGEPEQEPAAEPDAQIEEPPQEPASAGGLAAAEAPEEEPISDSALEFDPSRTDVSSVFVEQPPNPNWTAATGSFKAMVAANQEAAAEEHGHSQLEVEIDADFLASMLKSEAPASAPGTQPTPGAQPTAASTAPVKPPASRAPPAEPAASAAEPAAPAARQSSAGAAPARMGSRPSHAAPHTRPPFEAAAKPAAAREPATAAIAPRADLDAETPQVRPDWRAHLAWSAACSVAALLLLAQIVNHYRDDLAANPRFNRALTSLYSSLGVHLVPRWDLRAYDVRQLGADVDPSGTIIVRASIKNAAQQPQPLPLLRVTLQDRFGNRIASSDVAPRFYLPRNIPASAFLSAGQRIDAQMGFVDPGANAVGFELDACLPAGAGRITCANDSSTR